MELALRKTYTAVPGRKRVIDCLGRLPASADARMIPSLTVT
jgi:hypothetical protein